MTSILSESTNSDEDQDVDPLINQAYALLCEDKVDEGIQMYKKCIEQHPRCWRVYQNLGVAYIMLKDYHNANKVLKTYVAQVPRDPFGHDSLGVSYSQLNDPLQAIASFVNSINLSPGVVLAKLELYDYALNVYQHCLTLYPNYINAMNNIADIYKKTNRVDQAIAIFKQIIQMDPQYVLGIKNLGNCYFVKRDFYSATMTLIKAIQVDQRQESALHNLALCLDHYGLFGEAGYCQLRSYDSSAETDTAQTIVKPFIAGNLFNKQLHKLNYLLRLLVRFRKHPKAINRLMQTKFLNAYLAAVQSYTFASQLLPNCPQIHQNIQCTRLNFINYLAKLNKLSYILSSFPELNRIPEIQQVVLQLQKQKLFMKQVARWRKYTKNLVTKFEAALPFDDIKFLDQQQKVYQKFNKTLYYPIHAYKWKISTYISRAHRHNLSRLILKRTRFIQKYRKFSQEFGKVFRYRRPLTTLTEASQENNEGVHM